MTAEPQIKKIEIRYGNSDWVDITEYYCPTSLIVSDTELLNQWISDRIGTEVVFVSEEMDLVKLRVKFVE